ncbi:hypothetical protein GGS23DRAFT_412706 [Durotheca rogersii]|uniref:uncharacterized protein n=1 Tax=Durotheca rogersii TaxID=419775 RepID=UPI0022202ACD|nr:uncharacterized protein GGS23DRAFT_412706 [Durotheca rogersii]KAI5865170.1 hypothetical protein GGS23DRAFT_412706 [Durotheca rogersii]
MKWSMSSSFILCVDGCVAGGLLNVNAAAAFWETRSERKAKEQAAGERRGRKRRKKAGVEKEEERGGGKRRREDGRRGWERERGEGRGREHRPTHYANSYV